MAGEYEEVDRVANIGSPKPETASWTNYRNFGGIRNGFGFNTTNLDRSFRVLPTRYVDIGSMFSNRFLNTDTAGIGNQNNPENANCEEFKFGSETANEPQDFNMMTPGPSRSSSVGFPQPMDYTQQPQSFACQCPETQTGIQRENKVPRERVCSIYNMLNSPTNTPPAAHERNPNSINMGAKAPGPSPSPTPSITSMDSSSTLAMPLSISEQQFELLNKLYHICLDASTLYIRSLHPPSRTRSCTRSRQYHPYLPPTPSSRNRSSRNRKIYNEAGNKTLMDNISAISSYLWRKARKDGMAPHRAEQDAVAEMKELYALGERVVKGLEGSVGDEEEGEGIERWVGARASAAGMKFCAWLRDGRAWGVCGGIEEELRGLGGGRVDDETETEGSII